MNGIVNEIKEIFSVETVKDFGYAIAIGLGTAFVSAAALKLAGKDLATGAGKAIALGSGVLMGGLGAYIGKRYLNDPRMAFAGIFGAMFPFVYNWVESTINPQAYGEKLALSLSGTWRQGASQALEVSIPSEAATEVPAYSARPKVTVGV